jgi:putative membrane protein
MNEELDVMNAKLITFAGAVCALLSGAPLWAADTQGEHFLKESIQGNLAEVQVGDLAQQKGASQGVKDFGATLAKDHAAANDKAKQAAQSMGATLPSEPSVKQKTVYQELSALNGEQFDRHFIDSMVKDHREDIAKYQKEAQSGSGPAAGYAKEILPDLRKHLQIAERLQKEVRTASESSATKMK